MVAAIRALGRHRLLDLTAGLARGARCVLLRSAFGNGPLPCSRPWRLAPAELPKKAFIDNHVTRCYVRRTTCARTKCTGGNRRAGKQEVLGPTARGTGATPLTSGQARHACWLTVAPIRARCFNSKRTSFHVALELEHVESVDLRSEVRKADAVLPVFARAGQRSDTLKRVARRGRCRLLFLLGVQHIIGPHSCGTTLEVDRVF